MTSREIAEKVGISNGSAYYLLTSLIDKGLIKLENFKKSEQKTKYSYLLTPKGIREKSLITSKFLARKKKEYELLKIEITKIERDLSWKPAVCDGSRWAWYLTIFSCCAKCLRRRHCRFSRKVHGNWGAVKSWFHKLIRFDARFFWHPAGLERRNTACGCNQHTRAAWLSGNGTAKWPAFWLWVGHGVYGGVYPWICFQRFLLRW